MESVGTSPMKGPARTPAPPPSKLRAMRVSILEDGPERGAVVAAQLCGAGFATALARAVAVADLKTGA